MIKINRIQNDDLLYYEATFTNGNLIAFSINELITQLNSIHNFNFNLFKFNIN